MTGGRGIANPAIVLPEGDIQHPVQTVFDGPMALDLSFTRRWPNQTPLAGPGADPMQRPLRPAPVEGTAQCLAIGGHDLRLAGATGATSGARVLAQAVKHTSKAAGSISMNIRRKVSWAGMPLGRARNWRSHAITAQMAITRISISRCSTLPKQRGSSRSENRSISLPIKRGTSSPGKDEAHYLIGLNPQRSACNFMR